MNTQTTIEAENIKAVKLHRFRDEIYYPESHDDDLGESALHYKLLSVFFFLLETHLSVNSDVAVAANMNLYYEEGNSYKYYTPDLMIAFGAKKYHRQVYKLWEETVFPQVVFEIASDGTFENDLGGKRLDYARLGVEEYYLLDPEREYLPSPLMAFHRQNGRLLSADVVNNRVLSPLLNIEIVDTGKSFRLFNPNTKEFLQAVLTGEE